MFWLGFHIVSTAVCALALLYFMSPKTAQSAAKQQTTIVQSAVRFQSVLGQPDANSVLTMVNEYRIARGLQALRADSNLGEIARLRAEDMYARKYYSHTGSDGKNFFDMLSAAYGAPEYACENLALESGAEEDVYVASWVTSDKGHRECLFDGRATRAGYAVAQLYDRADDGNTQPYYVVVAIHSTE